MNETPNSDLLGLARLLGALDPWLSQIVLIGGWAHRLFRCHPLAQSLFYNPLFTLDTDVALPASLDVREQDLRKRLVDAGFQEQFFGDHHPPVTHYRLGQYEGAFYAEFLTPLIGSEYDRNGNPRVTSRIGGITSQNLRYLDLLLIAPWTVELSRSNGFPLSEPIQVPIANPACFIAQKILIHAEREPRSRAKDILYLHDTIELFSSSLEMLRHEWNKKGKPALAARAILTVENAASELFSKVTDDVRRAALAASGRTLSPEIIRETCKAGLGIVFPKT